MSQTSPRGLPQVRLAVTPPDTSEGNIMLISLLRAWRAHNRKAALTALARQLGPHLARDIGIQEAPPPRFGAIIKPF